MEFKTLTAENVESETVLILDWLKDEHPELLEELLMKPPELEEYLLNKTQSVLGAMVGVEDRSEVLSMMLPDREWENEKDRPKPLSPWAQQKHQEWRRAMINL